MPRRLARLYDSVVTFGKNLFSTKSDKGNSVPPGEPGMARMVGSWGSNGYGIQPNSKVEQVQHFREWNYRCIDYICGRISKTPPTAVLTVSPVEEKSYKFAQKAFLLGREPSPPDARAFAPRWWKTKSIGPAKAHEEYEFLDESDPLVQLLSNPNDPETGVSLWYEAELFNCLCGEDFIWMVTDGAGRVSELWVIPSNWIKPICLGKEKLVDYFEVSPRGGSTSGVVRFDPAEIIWNKMPSPLSKIYAASPLQAMANTVDSYEKTVAARNYGLDNGVYVNGVLQSSVATAPLDDAQINRIESRFLTKYAGVGNFGRPLILEGGLQWVPPPGDHELAFMSSVDMARKWIMGQWGLDEVVMGFGSVTTRAAAIAAMANVGIATIDPRRRRRAAVLTEKLAKLFDSNAKIFFEDDTPIDPDAQRQDYQIGGVLNAVAPNDYRTHVLQLEPFEEEIYDRPLVAGGLVNPGEAPAGAVGPDGVSLTAPFDNMGGDTEPDVSLKGMKSEDEGEESVAHNEVVLLAYADALIEAKNHDPDNGHASEVAEFLRYLLEHPEALATKSWDAAKHPRDDAGRWLSKEKIHERPKIDAALGGETDTGRTKRGEAKEEAERKRVDRSERLKKVQSLSNEISSARRGGEAVPASHFSELADHLPHLTVQELRSVRLKLAASFTTHEDGQKIQAKKREMMAESLLRHAKNEMERLNSESRYEHLDPFDFGALLDYENSYNAHGSQGNPNSEATHGGAMTTRHRLAASRNGSH
jgi:hypothetical protein